MDDILVYGSNMKEHDEHLLKVLHVLKENGRKLNDSKCHYHQSELKFLAQSISKDSVDISRDKVAAIQNLAWPTNVTEFKVTHNTCSLHLVSNFQNSSKHTKPSIENSTRLW